ncbi:MAG: Fe-S cluster assembly scaffold protein NifU [Methanopyri archaeon]|nr:Fe-S cluster assembly scaffold protein NifU [Methanopyri archaeon]
MTQIGYSKKVMEHFMNPRNVGIIEDADGYGKVGNPVCGDLMEIFINVTEDIISEIKFRTFGCGSAIATSSMVTELAKGMHIEEAMKITRQDVADELDGLPPKKMHCSNLAADALHAAIKDFRARNGEHTVHASCDHDCDRCDTPHPPVGADKKV